MAVPSNLPLELQQSGPPKSNNQKNHQPQCAASPLLPKIAYYPTDQQTNQATTDCYGRSKIHV